MNVKDHLGRSGRPLPDCLGMSDDSTNGVNRVGAKLVLPVVIVAELELDAEKSNLTNNLTFFHYST
jgi:hypothetical protein